MANDFARHIQTTKYEPSLLSKKIVQLPRCVLKRETIVCEHHTIVNYYLCMLWALISHVNLTRYMWLWQLINSSLHPNFDFKKIIDSYTRHLGQCGHVVHQRPTLIVLQSLCTNQRRCQIIFDVTWQVMKTLLIAWHTNFNVTLDNIFSAVVLSFIVVHNLLIVSSY